MCARPSGRGRPSTGTRRRIETGRRHAPVRSLGGREPALAQRGRGLWALPRPNPWNSALIDAGADVRFQRWSDDSVRSALAGFWIETGRSPHGSDLAAGHWPGPHPVTLRRRYGSVDAAWRALGPAPLSR